VAKVLVLPQQSPVAAGRRVRTRLLLPAASAFFVSPFDEAAIFSYDGVGEWTTTLYGMGRGNHITRLGEHEWVILGNHLGGMADEALEAELIS